MGNFCSTFTKHDKYSEIHDHNEPSNNQKKIQVSESMKQHHNKMNGNNNNYKGRTGRSETSDPEFIALLIDGNDLIFNTRYLDLGAMGGEELEDKLFSSIQTYEKFEKIFENSRIKSKRVVIMVFVDKEKVLKTLGGEWDLDKFFEGFQKSSNLATVVETKSIDVPTKMIAWMKLFSQNPHCRLLICGCTQSRYSTPLNYARQSTVQLGNHLYLLKGSEFSDRKVGSLGELNLNTLDWKYYFDTEKNILKSKSKIQDYQHQDDEENSVVNSSSGDSESQASSSSNRKPTKIKPMMKNLKVDYNKNWNNQNPKLCFEFYLNSQCNKTNCKNSHDYDLTSQEIDELRNDCKQFPCLHFRGKGYCRYGSDCIHHH